MNTTKQIGIDLGSRFVKMALFGEETTQFLRYDTVDFYKRYIIRRPDGISIDTERLGIPEDCAVTATGYGRNLMSFGNASVISEIKAHFRGALRTFGKTDFILVDIGGQDSKVIWARDGYIEDFVMNDKCAASTGRFAENASSTLGFTLEELGSMKENPADLSTTCAVFCESEIISLMASGTEPERIGAGINMSIAKRLAPLVKSYSAPYIFASGGAAENEAMLWFLSRLVDKEIHPVPEPQFNGALGCLNL